MDSTLFNVKLSYHFHMIYQSRPDNLLAFCSREMFRPLRVRVKISKTLGTSGMCYGRTKTQAGDSNESTLPWHLRLNNQTQACANETKRIQHGLLYRCNPAFWATLLLNFTYSSAQVGLCWPKCSLSWLLKISDTVILSPNRWIIYMYFWQLQLFFLIFDLNFQK